MSKAKVEHIPKYGIEKHTTLPDRLKSHAIDEASDCERFLRPPSPRFLNRETNGRCSSAIAIRCRTEIRKKLRRFCELADSARSSATRPVAQKRITENESEASADPRQKLQFVLSAFPPSFPLFRTFGPAVSPPMEAFFASIFASVLLCVLTIASILPTIFGCASKGTQSRDHLNQERPSHPTGSNRDRKRDDDTEKLLMSPASPGGENPNRYVSKECNQRSGLCPDDPDLRSMPPAKPPTSSPSPKEARSAKKSPADATTSGKGSAKKPPEPTTSNKEFGEGHARGVPHVRVKSHFLAK
ncbi:hypothetical protein L596_024614 [Steinernema carpocapsae]|uniref:Uncharacterized protein n=1 Tax=Steinernema carpocapsae TaxID=34508 RepID=A0A4U5M587_STECR|nr:hypothetical protein L596_024614 [Steinernema carpocapsae]